LVNGSRDILLIDEPIAFRVHSRERFEFASVLADHGTMSIASSPARALGLAATANDRLGTTRRNVAEGGDPLVTK
jgi:hypothetical protein